MSEPGHVFLYGQKHAGKTTLGRLLADRLSLAFLDLDDLIVELANDGHGPPSADARAVYRRHGAQGFRDFEARAARSLSQRLAYAPPTVCSLGGGTVGNALARGALEGLGLFVYLYVDTDELYRRISQTGRPAFLTSDDPRAEFMRLAAERDEVFRTHADVIVDLDALGPVDATDRLVEQLREHGFGGQ